MTLMLLRRCFRLLKKVGTTPADPRRAETRCFPMKAACEKQPKAYPLVYVEDCFEPRTQFGKERVLARVGWVGGTEILFSSLPEACNEL